MIELKEGDEIIWDSGYGYEKGIFISEGTVMYDSFKVNLTTGICQGESHRPKREVKPFSVELENELKKKYYGR